MTFILSVLGVPASIFISSLLVLSQKMLFTIHLDWPFLLTFVDYFFLFIIIAGMLFLKKTPNPKIGSKKTILMLSIINFSSSLFWIINIQRNSICLCQISRLFINPVIALYGIIRSKQSFSKIVLLISIILILVGTYIFISNESQFVFTNFKYSIIYIVFSSLARIFNSSFQRENKISSHIEFRTRIILYEFLLSFCLAFYMEIFRTKSFSFQQFQVSYYQKMFFLIFVPLTCLYKSFQYLIFDKLSHYSFVLVEYSINFIAAISGTFLFLSDQAESMLAFLLRILGYLLVFLGSIIIISSFIMMSEYESKFMKLNAIKLQQKDRNDIQLDQKFLTV